MSSEGGDRASGGNEDSSGGNYSKLNLTASAGCYAAFFTLALAKHTSVSRAS